VLKIRTRITQMSLLQFRSHFYYLHCISWPLIDVSYVGYISHSPVILIQKSRYELEQTTWVPERACKRWGTGDGDLPLVRPKTLNSPSALPRNICSSFWSFRRRRWTCGLLTVYVWHVECIRYPTALPQPIKLPAWRDISGTLLQLAILTKDYDFSPAVAPLCSSHPGACQRERKRPEDLTQNFEFRVAL